jgi:hypothetical protein
MTLLIAAIHGLELKHHKKNVCATSGMRCEAMLAQNKMSHCRAPDSMAVSVLPNVAIILPDPNPVLANEAGAKVGKCQGLWNQGLWNQGL